MVEREDYSSIPEEQAKKEIREEVESILDSKKALKKFKQIVEEQGKNIEEVSLSYLKPSPYVAEVKAKKDGIIREINNKLVAKIARMVGSPFYKDVGVFLEKKVGSKVKEGDVLMKIYALTEESAEFYKNYAERLVHRIFILKRG